METVDLVKEVEKVTAPTTPVPIMGTVTEEDVNNAGRYNDGTKCLLATMLKRMGYGKHYLMVYSDGAVIDGQTYTVNGFASELGWNVLLGTYNRSVIGKQFIFYPGTPQE